jgi:hypothetical protein
MAYYPDARARKRHNLLVAPVLAFIAVGIAAAGYIGYVLWPRWPDAPVTLQSPALPIIVGGAMFNIEPAAIRRSVQRKPGTQDRVDLSYLWPSLTPPDPTAKPDPKGPPANPNERIFLTLAEGREALPPLERVRTIYPRYLADPIDTRPDGLAVRAFRDASPYKGEDLVYAEAAPDDFTARCTRSGVGNSGMCLLQRRIGEADITVRFPRDWLADWKKVLYGIDSLIVRLHPDAK